MLKFNCEHFIAANFTRNVIEKFYDSVYQNTIFIDTEYWLMNTDNDEYSSIHYHMTWLLSIFCDVNKWIWTICSVRHPWCFLFLFPLSCYCWLADSIFHRTVGCLLAVNAEIGPREWLWISHLWPTLTIRHGKKLQPRHFHKT